MTPIAVTGAELSELLSGLVVSLELTGASLAIGYPFGILLALFVGSRHKALSWPGLAVVEVGRGVPTLVLLYLLYYGLPSYGLTFTAFVTSVLALGFSTGAYTSEIFAASIRTVPTGQREAGHSLGLTESRIFVSVVLPQAVRIALPQLVSFAILVFQGTALCVAVAVPELLSVAYQIGAETFAYLEVLLVAGALYLVISVPVAQLAGRYDARVTRRY